MCMCRFVCVCIMHACLHVFISSSSIYLLKPSRRNNSRSNKNVWFTDLDFTITLTPKRNQFWRNHCQIWTISSSQWIKTVMDSSPRCKMRMCDFTLIINRQKINKYAHEKSRGERPHPYNAIFLKGEVIGGVGTPPVCNSQ